MEHQANVGAGGGGGLGVFVGGISTAQKQAAESAGPGTPSVHQRDAPHHDGAHLDGDARSHDAPTGFVPLTAIASRARPEWFHRIRGATAPGVPRCLVASSTFALARCTAGGDLGLTPALPPWCQRDTRRVKVTRLSRGQETP